MTDGIIVISLFMLLLAAAPVVWVPADVGVQGGMRREALAAHPLATMMQVEHHGLIAYGVAHPGASGTIPASSLNLATPYGTNSTWIVTVIGPTAAGTLAVTYFTGATFLPGSVVSALADVNSYAQDSGLTTAGGLASPWGTLTPLPAGVPLGVPAIADLVPSN